MVFQAKPAGHDQITAQRLLRFYSLNVLVCTIPAAYFLYTWHLKLAAVCAWGIFGLLAAGRVFKGDARGLLALTIALLPILLLTRNFILFNLPIALMFAELAFYYYRERGAIGTLLANRFWIWLLIAGTAYWLSSWYMIGLSYYYFMNLRVLEMLGAALLIFTFITHVEYLKPAFLGMLVTQIISGFAFLRYGSRLGMADVGDQVIGNPIAFGLPIVVVLTLLLCDGGRWIGLSKNPRLRWTLSAVAAVLLILSTSRGSWLAIGLVGITLMFLDKSQRKASVVVMMLALISLGVILFTPRGVEVDNWINRTVNPNIPLDSRTSGRADQWKVFPSAFMAAPLFGHGPGTGQWVWAKYSLMVPGIQKRVGNPTPWHTLFLQIGVELGGVGLLLFLAMLWGVFVGCRGYYRLSGVALPLACFIAYIGIALSVSGIDAASGMFLGFALVGTEQYRRLRLAGSRQEEEYVITAVNLTKELIMERLPELFAIDADVIGEHWEKEHWLMEMPRKWELSWVLIDDTKIVGFVVASQKGLHQMHYHRCAVAPGRRSAGYGQALFSIAATRALELGLETSTAKVHAANPGSRRFLDRLGFEVVQDGPVVIHLSIPTTRLVEGGLPLIPA